MSDYHFLDGPAQADTAGGPGPRSPTRRRLPTLLATAAVSVSANTPTLPTGDAGYDSTARLFVQFQQIVAAHERAQGRIDGTEATLVARLGFPRMRLPTSLDPPPLYAADTNTIDQHICRPGPPHVPSSASSDVDSGLGRGRPECAVLKPLSATWKA